MMNNPLTQNESPQLPALPSTPSHTPRTTTEGTGGNITVCNHTLTSNTSGSTPKTPRMANKASAQQQQQPVSDGTNTIKNRAGNVKTAVDETSQQPQTALPKCMCNWKNCRAYQKAFRQVKHPSFDGVVKIKLVQNHPESMSYKGCLDRTLGISNPPEWKVSATAVANAAANGRPVAATCKYVIAKHHFTERHMQKYDGDPKGFSFVKPFSVHGAKKYLFTMDPNETLPGDESTGKLYMQCPNVPKDVVKQEFHQAMVKLKKNPNPTTIPRSNASHPVSTSPLNKSSKESSAKRLSTHYSDNDDEESSTNNNDQQLALLKSKEIENQRLKEHLDAMKSQLSFLHDMVVKLQEHHFDNASHVSGRSRQSVVSRNNNRRKSSGEKKISGATATTSSMSRTSEGGRLQPQPQSRYTNTMSQSGTRHVVGAIHPKIQNKNFMRRGSNGVPDEINVDDDDGDINDLESQTIVSNFQDGDWTETHHDSEEEDDEDEDEEDEEDGNDGVSIAERTTMTQSTFKTKYKMTPQGSSDGPRIGDDEDEDDDGDDDDEEDEEDGDFDLMSLAATTIVSASKSVKSLPREIELEEDEDSSSDQDVEEEDFDSKSFASRVSQKFKYNQYSSHNDDGTRSIVSITSQQSRKTSVIPGQQKHSRTRDSANRSVGQGSNKKSNRKGGGEGFADKAPRISHRRKSIGTNSITSRSNVSSGNHEVINMEVTDPYGEKGSYTGSVSMSTGMPHGYGRLEYERAGCWYEGDWRHGQWNGHGRLSNGDGDLYEGGLKNDHKHGHGVMKFADGRTFEGEYVNGQMILGRMTYQDGSMYDGSWEEGMRHGFGVCVFTDESVYEGEFRDGDFNGFGKMTWNDGGWYEGVWMNGEMHGRGREIRADGSLRHSGEWVRGQPLRHNQQRQQQQVPTNDPTDSMSPAQ
jgi:hypothetical protein